MLVIFNQLVYYTNNFIVKRTLKLSSELIKKAQMCFKIPQIECFKKQYTRCVLASLRRGSRRTGFQNDIPR